MGINAAVEAYRQSAYQKLEYNIESSVGRASFPILGLGGIKGDIKGFGNVMVRPIRMGSAYVFGGKFPLDKIKKAKIPDDLAHTKYAEALEKTREYGHEAADLRAESYRELFSGRMGGYFRNRRAARYAENQSDRVILPDEGGSIVTPLVRVGTMYAIAHAMSPASHAGFDVLGNMSPPATPILVPGRGMGLV